MYTVESRETPGSQPFALTDFAAFRQIKMEKATNLFSYVATCNNKFTKLFSPAKRLATG